MRDWLNAFEQAVRKRDFSAGIDLYDNRSTLFGTRVRWSQSVEEYYENQWKVIWNSSSDFRFNQTLQVHDSGAIVTCALLWLNNTVIDDLAVSRSGRATFVLERKMHEILAIHSHFSEDPALH